MSTDAIARKLIEGRNSMQIACRLNLNLQRLADTPVFLLMTLLLGRTDTGASSRWSCATLA